MIDVSKIRIEMNFTDYEHPCRNCNVNHTHLGFDDNNNLYRYCAECQMGVELVDKE